MLYNMTRQTSYFVVFFFVMIRRPPRSTLDRSSAASDVYKRQIIPWLEWGEAKTEIFISQRNIRPRREFSKGRDLICLLYTSPSPRDRTRSRMPSSA